MSDWWSKPSTWAPQRGHIVWTRQMDWVALAGWENSEETPKAVANTIGVSERTLFNRLALLRAAVSANHWRKRT